MYKNGDWVNLKGLSTEDKIKVVLHVNKGVFDESTVVDAVEQHKPNFIVRHFPFWFLNEDIQPCVTDITQRVLKECELIQKPTERLSTGDTVEFTMNERVYIGEIKNFDELSNARVVTSSGREILIPQSCLTLIERTNDTHEFLKKTQSPTDRLNEFKERIPHLSPEPESTGKKYNHYHKDVSHLTSIDVYRGCDLWGVKDDSGAVQHSIKKLLNAGERGSKGYTQDLIEARDSIQRKLDMLGEDV